MSFTKNLTSLFPLFFTLLTAPSIHAATFQVTNECPYTVWAAAAWPGSSGNGQQLNSGQRWTFTAAPGTVGGRIWGRTNCSFYASGRGKCETGDCNGLLRCIGYGSPPNTLAVFALNLPNKLDFVAISLVDGFNLPMDFGPVTAGTCKDLQCTANINGECPAELWVPGGCHNPCTVYGTNEYCCTKGPGRCRPPALSQFFKTRCPDAYSYPWDDKTSLFTCPAGTNYKVVFCSRKNSFMVPSTYLICSI
ncbi:hypothetical protein NMG60_11027146 [Bertholletia excelsa]